MANKIKYTEPNGYFSKEMRDAYNKATKASKPKKTTAKKTTKKK